jgi:hypothetical protein
MQGSGCASSSQFTSVEQLRSIVVDARIRSMYGCLTTTVVSDLTQRALTEVQTWSPSM